MTPETFLGIILPFFEYFDSDRVADNKLAMRAWFKGLSDLAEFQLVEALEKAVFECDRGRLPSPKKVLDLYMGDTDVVAGLEQWKLVIQAIAASVENQAKILAQLDHASDFALGAMGGLRHLAENTKPEYLHSLEQKRFLELRSKYGRAIATGQVKPSAKLAPAPSPSTPTSLAAVFEEAEYNPQIWKKMRANLEKAVSKRTRKEENSSPPVLDLDALRQAECDRANELLKTTSPENLDKVIKKIERSGYLTIVYSGNGNPQKVILTKKAEEF